jgi:predicted dinucleotide-utilizing enzyme
MSSSPPTPSGSAAPVRVGVLGFGKLGQYLVARLLEAPAAGERSYELAFVWARDASKIACCDAPRVPAALVASGALTDELLLRAQLVVEVAHPDVTRAVGARVARAGLDLFLGSPTALADAALEAALAAAAAAAAADGRRARLLVPAGALWGAQDIARLGRAGGVASLHITMRKHPASLAGHVRGATGAALAAGAPAGEAAWTLYDGPLRALARDAENNVNTMAAAALAVPALGFDGVRGTLVADARATAHVITIELLGPRGADGAPGLAVRAERAAPAPPGAVTSDATLASFWASLRAAIAGAGAGAAGVVLV